MLDLTDHDVNELTSQLFATAKIDLRNYAKSSLKRRFTRLSEILSLNSPEEMIKYISTLKSANDFIDSITVNTTEMFRDPNFWQVLRTTILPALAENDEITIWHAGCSTGEEVISMQILLEELGLRSKSKTFACDINTSVLNAAKTGTYRSKNFDLSQNNYLKSGGLGQLEKYTSVRNDNNFTFLNHLYSNVEFGQFDLVQETLDVKFDLILCRNVLIYFEFGLQETVITKFINSLKPFGCLAIGEQETIINSTLLQRLAVANEAEKIYRLHN